MNRPNQLNRTALFLALPALLLAPHFVVRATEATTARPNVLFIIADDASRHFGEAYGCNWVKTPNIDREPAYWPDNDLIRCDMLDYAIEVEAYDAQVGSLLTALQASGEAKNTLIIVTSVRRPVSATLRIVLSVFIATPVTLRGTRCRRISPILGASKKHRPVG